MSDVLVKTLPKTLAIPSASTPLAMQRFSTQIYLHLLQFNASRVFINGGDEPVEVIPLKYALIARDDLCLVVLTTGMFAVRAP